MAAFCPENEEDEDFKQNMFNVVLQDMKWNKYLVLQLYCSF